MDPSVVYGDHMIQKCFLKIFTVKGFTANALWSVITKAVAVCVNNPQNERNQSVCCSLLPLALKFITSEPPQNPGIRHVLALISSVVANNTSNQNRLRQCGGLEELAKLIKLQQSNHSDLTVSNIVYVVSALDACIADNASSGIEAGNLDMISVILQFVEDFDHEPADLKTLLLAVAHILESHEKFSHCITEGKAYDQLVKLLTTSQDEELFKTIKYIFSLCRVKGRL
ncbi:telomere repeats-binding bouquet formation protein 1 [Elysia marginata]|uniref:Telomere repeats-binding bouquet formation protein 1 n=1 Tax=Elysia marginata TaxID=1093978 RepID=A0AAV4JSL4_9GAST|nr:telomere repeats-binding bouquet formation protein 1 [Elysia marginata]